MAFRPRNIRPAIAGPITPASFSWADSEAVTSIRRRPDSPSGNASRFSTNWRASASSCGLTQPWPHFSIIAQSSLLARFHITICEIASGALSAASRRRAFWTFGSLLSCAMSADQELLPGLGQHHAKLQCRGREAHQPRRQVPRLPWLEQGLREVGGRDRAEPAAHAAHAAAHPAHPAAHAAHPAHAAHQRPRVPGLGLDEGHDQPPEHHQAHRWEHRQHPAAAAHPAAHPTAAAHASAAHPAAHASAAHPRRPSRRPSRRRPSRPCRRTGRWPPRR